MIYILMILAAWCILYTRLMRKDKQTNVCHDCLCPTNDDNKEIKIPQQNKKLRELNKGDKLFFVGYSDINEIYSVNWENIIDIQYLVEGENVVKVGYKVKHFNPERCRSYFEYYPNTSSDEYHFVDTFSNCFSSNKEAEKYCKEKQALLNSKIEKEKEIINKFKTI